MPNKGIIMLNGRQYGDTGTNYNVVKCTKQEYDAMTPEQKNNGCLYIVVDSAGNSVNYLSAQVAGAKTDDTMTNLLNPTLATTTINGVTCTNNGDGTYTINGTASANTYFLIARNITIVAGKPMRIVGCPSGGSGNTYKSGLWIEGTAEDDIGLGNTFTLEEDTTFDQFRIVVYAGTTVENLVFKPMLTTDLSASYDDFVAYTGLSLIHI